MSRVFSAKASRAKIVDFSSLNLARCYPSGLNDVNSIDGYTKLTCLICSTSACVGVDGGVGRFIVFLPNYLKMWDNLLYLSNKTKKKKGQKHKVKF